MDVYVPHSSSAYDKLFFKIPYSPTAVQQILEPYAAYTHRLTVDDYLRNEMLYARKLSLVDSVRMMVYKMPSHLNRLMSASLRSKYNVRSWRMNEIGMYTIPPLSSPSHTSLTLRPSIPMRMPRIMTVDLIKAHVALDDVRHVFVKHIHAPTHKKFVTIEERCMYVLHSTL